MYRNHSHTVLLLSSRFQYSDRRLFFTRARLFFDRIELTGWHLGKKHERAITLDKVQRIEWEAQTSVAILHLIDSKPVQLQLAHPDSWKQSLEQLLWWNASNYFPEAETTITSTARQDTPLKDLITYATSMG